MFLKKKDWNLQMKLDEGLIIRNIAGEDVLVPIGNRVIRFVI